jgi:adenylate kinase family enzyme
MIIHIIGPAGSEKTELGKKISSELNIDVIDFTDDIYNPNLSKLMSKYNYETGEIGSKQYNIKPNQINKLLKIELLKQNQEYLNKKIENYKDKNLIILGDLHKMNINIKPPNTDVIDIDQLNIDKGYYIKTDNEIHYKENNIELITRIRDNYKNIKEIINSDISAYEIGNLIYMKYNISDSFLSPFEYWKKDIGYIDKKVKDLNYKYATDIEIFNDIEKILIF